jgi:murein DD-endopeptidase MepM/ murein hydrolase activator NlpD
VFKFLLLALPFVILVKSPWSLPVKTVDRRSVETLQLSEIGDFGLLRKARPTVKAHYHTGIDIRRPGNNYLNEPVFAIAEGTVISKRTDGPYAQLIIEHESEGQRFWTVYEHIAGITVKLHERVNSDQPIARFMNKSELNRYGWQFDHFHFEILKVAPVRLKTDNVHPDRIYASYTLGCYTKEQLNRYFYNPLEFFKENVFGFI